MACPPGTKAVTQCRKTNLVKRTVKKLEKAREKKIKTKQLKEQLGSIQIPVIGKRTRRAGGPRKKRAKMDEQVLGKRAGRAMGGPSKKRARK
jgi:hypothetical protein